MFSSWSDGYLTDFGYVYGFYPELSPAHIQFALANMGFLPPSTDEVFHYCELGFGQGVTLNVLGCTYPAGRFIGNDFSPEHVHFARTLQAVSQSDVSAYEDSFEQFCDRPLPEFDFVVAHGVWSWVNPTQWHHLVRFVRERLRPGGVFYVSYNALPGWAKFMPMHELLVAMSRLGLPADLDMETRIRLAMAVAKRVFDLKCGYFEINPAVRERFERLCRENPHYLAHEYLNLHWTPVYFHQVDRLLREAKLTFTCSANLASHLDFLELNDVAREVLTTIESPTVRETLRDFLCNRQFRSDLYVKGPVRLSRHEQRSRLLRFAFALRVPAQSVSLSIEGPVGKADLDPALYHDVISKLDANLDRAVSLREMLEDEQLARYGFEQVYQALFALVAKRDVAVVGTSTQGCEEVEQVKRLNAWILEQAVENLGLPLLIDPVTRGVLDVDHVEQLFVQGLARGLEADDSLVDYVDRLLGPTGRQLVDRSGKTLTDREARHAYLIGRLVDVINGRKLMESRGILETMTLRGNATGAPSTASNAKPSRLC